MSAHASTLLVATASFIAALVGCEVVRRVALARALLDAPNERSLHSVPKPRLGGVAVCVATTLAAAARFGSASPELRTVAVVCAGVAVLGFVDDVRPLSAAVRFPLQLVAAAALLSRVGVPPFLLAPGIELPIPGWLTAVLLSVWVVGVLNIYNFMDGMDGLAGAQAVAACAGLAFVVGAAGFGGGFLAALAGASLGFLAHNYPPARLFLGDAGSTFIGMAFASLAIVGLRRGVPLGVSALALSPFLLDGTFTLVRRALRRERIWQAHRTHLYQRAVQTGLEHRDVLLVYVAWMAAGAAATMLATATATAVATAIAWAVQLAGLVGVWRWVARRESERAKLA